MKLVETVQRVLLEAYAPACVLINGSYEILYFHGPTHNYLAQPTGPPTQNLLACAREGLRTKLRGALHRANQSSGQPVTLTSVRVKRDDRRVVKITITPLRAPREVEGLFVVAFMDQPKLVPPAVLESPGSDESLLHAAKMIYEINQGRPSGQHRTARGP